MAGKYLGPYTKACGLSIADLDKNEVSPVECLQNGLILELKAHLGSARHVLSVLQALDERFQCTNTNALEHKLQRLSEKKKKLGSKKKVNGYNSVKDLLSTQLRILNLQEAKTDANNEIVQDLVVEEPSIRCEDGADSNEQATCILQVTPLRKQREETYKESNFLQYEIEKKKKMLDRINNDITSAQERLVQINKMIGHYSVKNVNKRDETSRKNLHSLRESQRKNIQLLRQIEKFEKQSSTDLEKIKCLQNRICNHVELCEQYRKTENILKSAEKKKVNAQKMASYYKNSAKKLKAKFASSSQENNTDINRENDQEVQYLQLEVDKLSDILQNTVKTKSKDGSFSNNIRLCVLELTGLEVANEKVSPVIMAVSKHLFGRDFPKEDLPSSKTIRSIIDEGHFMAKSYIAEKLSDTASWGLNRDGTTRKKHKLLDTSVTLASGDVISLGFTRVHKETAVAINDTTKEHMTELAQLHSNTLNNPSLEDETADDFVRSSLQKLAFSMSDRAANEKKANQLLTDWRNDVLQQCDGDKDEILQFYCMAHVLLGFHTYAVKELQVFEKDIGPLGRSSLKNFEHWKDKGSVVERVCRTVSEVFGPAGDHHGARDLWEAFCASNGVKSLIGNYRHNRFNALFQTAAEILVHRQDFIVILESIKLPNLLLKSVLADLKCDLIAVLLQCLGLFYIKLTGPFWNFVANSKVPYLHLYEHVAQIDSMLSRCETEPAEILTATHWSQDDQASVASIPHRQRIADVVFLVPEKHREHLFDSVKRVARGMKGTVAKQLTDFLPGGRFSKAPSETDLKRSSFAQVTNLGCEHHFGDLDSSQRRRPSATLHHHSSVQLIKRNRSKMMKWLQEMDPEKQRKLMISARKGGKTLRELHIHREKSVLSEINEGIKNCDKKRKSECGNEQQPISRRRLNISEDETIIQQPDISDVNVNNYVAIAYDDNWYPGVVINKKDDMHIEVNFMCHTQRAGIYRWPQREDIQTVEASYILKKGFIPECVNSGRLWKIMNHHQIEQIYDDFRNIHFK